MEQLAQLVADSLARHNFETPVDHRRLAWSKWFRCQSSFDLLLVPGKPGLFALGEEVIAPGETPATGGRRMLALFEVGQAEDLSAALGRLFLPNTPSRARLSSGNCLARYCVIEDETQRRKSHAAFQQWLSASAEGVSGIANSPKLESAPFSGGISQHIELGQEHHARVEAPSSFPSGF